MDRPRSDPAWKRAYALLVQASFPHDELRAEDLAREEGISIEEAEDRILDLMYKHAAKPQRKDEGTKPPVSDTCDDCGADIDACGCKNMATAGPDGRAYCTVCGYEHPMGAHDHDVEPDTGDVGGRAEDYQSMPEPDRGYTAVGWLAR